MNSYRTSPHPARYSAAATNRPTLELLWYLRASLMKRTAFIVSVLAALIAISANGSPVHPAKAHKNASATASAKSPKKTVKHPAAAKRSSAEKHLPAHAAKSVTGHTLPHKAKPATARKTARAPERKQVAAAVPCSSPTPAPVRPTPARPVQTSPALIRPELSKIDPAVEADVPTPPAAARPASLRRKQGFLSQPLRGSYESLVRQNQKTEADGLERILDDDDLADRIAHKMLVKVPASAGLMVNPGLPENRRYCRPWAANFLADLARAHAAQFHRPVIVSSAVRTVEYQKRLMEINGNAAAAEGDIASPHLTGATVDIAKQGLSRRELVWLRAWLVPLIAADKIDVEEEFQQACFHITVYKSYVPLALPRNTKPHKFAPTTQMASRGL
ncbi:MAG: DUF5715 family protein [Terracidiphilus sp.]|nr:DUF5715 family protein [Terracidiphilus sp.]